jgi:hypothetical protein
VVDLGIGTRPHLPSTFEAASRHQQTRNTEARDGRISIQADTGESIRGGHPLHLHLAWNVSYSGSLVQASQASSLSSATTNASRRQVTITMVPVTMVKLNHQVMKAMD